MARRMLALFTALVLVTSLTLAVFAADWDLDNGDIIVSASDTDQTVKQGTSEPVSDKNPTIKGGDGTQKITVTTTGDAEANLTINGVNAKTIDVDKSNATITVEGDNNKVENDSGAGIHVTSGDLTITGDGTLTAQGGATAAGIGSNWNQGMSGSITIEGSAKVTGSSTGSGAGIGSGTDGELSGSITIGGNAEVTGIGGHGAGIGSGSGGKLSGDITIEGNATVKGSGSFGAGIGSGWLGEVSESGSITIKDNANVTGTGTSGGAGIGSGSSANMAGNITIGDTANVTANASAGYYSGAGIGSGGGNGKEMSGTIAISTKATVNASSMNGEPIGAGAGGTNTGTIRFFDPDPTGTTALYRVVDDNGISTGYKSEVKDGVLTITVSRPDANLVGTLSGLQTLTRWGVETIVFETENATSTFALNDLIAKGTENDTFRLTHKAEEVTLTLNGNPVEDVLK